MLLKMNAGLIGGLLSLALSMNVQATSEKMETGQEKISQADSMDHMQMHQQHMQQMQSGNMPMMNARCEHMMKDKPMPDTPMANNMMQMRQPPMWQGPDGRMPMMDPQRRDYMMRMRQRQMMNMDRRGMMKQEMMQMRQQHMKNMEERLANIEKLLTELVELQKK